LSSSCRNGDHFKALSADEEARYRALARERALHDEATLLKDAEERGEKRGEQRGREDSARNLLRLGLLDNAQIAQATGLSEERVQALRERVQTE
jgi:predicted transposase YdaD